jgi:hypothetical protein
MKSLDKVNGLTVVSSYGNFRLGKVRVADKKHRGKDNVRRMPPIP